MKKKSFKKKYELGVQFADVRPGGTEADYQRIQAAEAAKYAGKGQKTGGIIGGTIGAIGGAVAAYYSSNPALVATGYKHGKQLGGMIGYNAGAKKGNKIGAQKGQEYVQNLNANRAQDIQDNSVIANQLMQYSGDEAYQNSNLMNYNSSPLGGSVLTGGRGNLLGGGVQPGQYSINYGAGSTDFGAAGSIKPYSNLDLGLTMASQGAEAMSQWNQGGKNQINFGSNKGQQNSVAGVTNMAAMGAQSTDKALVEVEKDELVFRRDPKNPNKIRLVADFVGGKPHSQGGEDFVAQEGDIIFPGKKRQNIKQLLDQNGYVRDINTFAREVQKLPEDTQEKPMTEEVMMKKGVRSFKKPMYEDGNKYVDVKDNKEFEKAFATARANKQLFFNFDGRDYHTLLKEEATKEALDNVKSKYQEYLKGTESTAPENINEYSEKEELVYQNKQRAEYEQEQRKFEESNKWYMQEADKAIAKSEAESKADQEGWEPFEEKDSNKKTIDVTNPPKELFEPTKKVEKQEKTKGQQVVNSNLSKTSTVAKSDKTATPTVNKEKEKISYLSKPEDAREPEPAISYLKKSEDSREPEPAISYLKKSEDSREPGKKETPSVVVSPSTPSFKNVKVPTNTPKTRNLDDSFIFLDEKTHKEKMPYSTDPSSPYLPNLGRSGYYSIKPYTEKQTMFKSHELEDKELKEKEFERLRLLDKAYLDAYKNNDPTQAQLYSERVRQYGIDKLKKNPSHIYDMTDFELIKAHSYFKNESNVRLIPEGLRTKIERAMEIRGIQKNATYQYGTKSFKPKYGDGTKKMNAKGEIEYEPISSLSTKNLVSLPDITFLNTQLPLNNPNYTVYSGREKMPNYNELRGIKTSQKMPNYNELRGIKTSQKMPNYNELRGIRPSFTQEELNNINSYLDNNYVAQGTGEQSSLTEQPSKFGTFLKGVPGALGNFWNNTADERQKAGQFLKDNQGTLMNLANQLIPEIDPKGKLADQTAEAYARSLMAEKPEIRQPTQVSFATQRYQDRSAPLRNQLLLNQKMLQTNSRNASAGSGNVLLSNLYQQNAGLQNQIAQIENQEALRADQVDASNTNINNQQAQVNAQFYDQNVTANEQNRAVARNLNRQGFGTLSGLYNSQAMNNYMVQRDRAMMQENQRANNMKAALQQDALLFAMASNPQAAMSLGPYFKQKYPELHAQFEQVYGPQADQKIAEEFRNKIKFDPSFIEQYSENDLASFSNQLEQKAKGTRSFKVKNC